MSKSKSFNQFLVELAFFVGGVHRLSTGDVYGCVASITFGILFVPLLFKKPTVVNPSFILDSISKEQNVKICKEGSSLTYTFDNFIIYQRQTSNLNYQLITEVVSKWLKFAISDSELKKIEEAVEVRFGDWNRLMKEWEKPKRLDIRA